MRTVVVGKVSEIPPGSSRIVDVDGRSIGVFNVDGRFHAIRNACPHAGGPLCEGVRSGLVLSSVPGQYSYVRRGEFVRCPWHQWEFDITTGRSWFDPGRTRVASYETAVRTGADLARDEELVEAGLAPGPYTVETFRVDRDGEYVVLQF